MIPTDQMPFEGVSEMKTSILWGSALVLVGMLAVSCDKSTEPDDLPGPDLSTDTTGTGTGGGGTTVGPGTVTINSSPLGDVILDSATITIVANKPGDSILFTTSGVDPQLGDDLYARSFPITGTTTIKAAALRGGKLGKVTTRVITITNKVYKPSFSTSRVDSFSEPVEVKITPANEMTDTVFYTMSNTPGSPSRSSNRSRGIVTVTQSSFLVARSFNGKNSPSEPETTQIVLKVAKPTPSAASGNQSNIFSLFFASKSPGISMRFTRNGTVPNCTNSELQKTDSILVDSNQTIVAVGCRDGWTPSDTTKVSYKFKVGPVSTTPDSGIHASLPQIEFKSATPGATFFYTTDSTLPAWNPTTLVPSNGKTFKWTAGSTKINIQKSLWLRAVAVKSGWLNSDTLTSRFVYIGDSALIDDFELSGLGSKFGEKGLSWFACQYQNGLGCSQDQKFLLERTLPRLDTTKPDWRPGLGFRAWRVQVGISQYGEDFHAGYAGSSVRVPPEYPGNAYRLVFWAKWQDTTGKGVSTLPFIIEMALAKNANNNGGYSDGFHRRVTTVGPTWQQFEVEFDQFYGAGNGYAGSVFQPESTSTSPKAPALFFADASMHALGLSGWQGHVGRNLFTPAWRWDVSKEAPFSKGDITAFRFSVMQPMTPAAAETVGPVSPSWMNPHESRFTQSQLDALTKNIGGYLWIDNVRLVRKSVN